MNEHVSGRKPTSNWALLVTMTVITSLILFAFAEIAVRVRQAIKYGSAATVSNYYRFDERTELRVPIAGLAEGNIRVNSLGFRGPELVSPKPNKRIRLGFIGASTTWCGEVSSNEAVWAHIITDALAERFPNHSFDYVNGGVPGYTTKSSLRNLELRVGPTQPDILVIYHGSNDLTGELRSVAKAQGVTIDRSAFQPSWFSDYSLLWNLAEKNLRILWAQHKASENPTQIKLPGTGFGSAFFRNLTGLVKAAKEHADYVVLVTFSTHLRPEQSRDYQLKAADSALYYMPFANPRLLLEAYARYNDIIRSVATENNVILVDGPELIPGDDRHFTDTIHLSDLGSKRMAERILPAISEIVPPHPGEATLGVPGKADESIGP